MNRERSFGYLVSSMLLFIAVAQLYFSDLFPADDLFVFLLLGAWSVLGFANNAILHSVDTDRNNSGVKNG